MTNKSAPQGQAQNPMGQQNPGQIQQQQAKPQMKVIQLPQIDVSPLDSLQGEERNNFVGNNIYAHILAVLGQQNAPRITGMLLDESVINFNQLLTDSQYFSAKVYEAHSLLLKSQVQ